MKQSAVFSAFPCCAIHHGYFDSVAWQIHWMGHRLSGSEETLNLQDNKLRERFVYVNRAASYHTSPPISKACLITNIRSMPIKQTFSMLAAMNANQGVLIAHP